MPLNCLITKCAVEEISSLWVFEYNLVPGAFSCLSEYKNEEVAFECRTRKKRKEPVQVYHTIRAFYTE